MEKRNETENEKPRLSRNQAGQAPKSGSYEKITIFIVPDQRGDGQEKDGRNVIHS